jgi:putative surface-exposed virulence protein
MTVSGGNAVAMYGQNNTTLVNNGTINLGDSSLSIAENGTGLVAFKAVGDNVTAYNQGTVNINADGSYVFDRAGSATAHLVNTGEVNVRAGVTSYGLVKGEAGTVVDTTSVYRSTVSNYTVGTTAAGTSGTMTVSHADLNDVSVDTGFTSGTAAQTQTFDNVFVGEDIQGAENIQSTSVVWSASAQTDQSGNVDVTMSKNSYQDVVSSDASAQNMAATLDANYTNNALYSSLNLQTASEVDKAMRQLSGVDATTAFKEARVLSQRFNMLADNAIVLPSGFGFNLVDKNDKRSELGNDTRYDMMALSQSFDLSAGQKMQMQYGIARLDGNGIDGKSKAGDNGLTGGYSQFFGINHSVDFGSLKLTNALRYDVHQLESNRSIRYSGVNQTASSDNSQQYMEWRSQFSRGFDVAEGLNLTPSVGMKLRHTNNDACSERGAGDFNLNMDSSNETAVDAVIGVQMKYAASNGWAMNALLEGGPNLSYTQSAQKASLQGANNASFTMNDDQQGGGFNGVAKMGLSYGGKAGKLAFDAYQWKEDDIVDKGLSLGYQYNF